MAVDPEIRRFPPAQRRSLAAYESLLAEVAVPRGIVARADAPHVHDRHVMDSLRVLACLGEGAVTIADLGSGAGLPGVPVAIARPDCDVTLVEPQARRVAFLELVLDTLGLPNVRILRARAETAALRADVVLARAVASPAGSWGLARPNLRDGGSLLYFAGSSWAESELPPREEVDTTICAGASFPWQGPVVRMRARSIRP
jgi:16S rRNA (guanine527-N7)-methyltransferase